MEDIEIARKAKLKPIKEVAEMLNLSEEELQIYGKNKAKIEEPKVYEKLKNKPDGKLILVTAINPTPLGEGKTTMSIGLADGMTRINKKAILALREPSLGPVFGIKGGATGGGMAQIAPMEEINLHFTGDLHAITSANNLLAAMIDNHIYFGNELNFKRVVWKRCLDLNDRVLRKIQIGLAGEKNTIPREDGFEITVASEVMAIFCLAKDLQDLKRRLGNVIVGYNIKEEPIRARDLKAEGAMTVLLKDAFKPNLVQTLEQTPAMIHGGPFANIAHGCNSVVATKLALKLADYVITEAGFGADLGAEKFLDIKCRKTGIKPDAVVCVATLKALKYHGGAKVETVATENLTALTRGVSNLLKHIDNLKNKFGLNVIVAINKYSTDTEKEIRVLTEILEEKQIPLTLVESHQKGSEGAIDFASKVVQLVEQDSQLEWMYQLEDSIKEKIEKVATKIYGAKGVVYSEKAEEQIKQIEKLGYKDFPICISKTQYSLSDNAENLECLEPFDIHVQEVIVKAGAEFIVVLTGNVFTMPGLPKKPAAENIDLDLNGNVIGIF